MCDQCLHVGSGDDGWHHGNATARMVMNGVMAITMAMAIEGAMVMQC